VCVNEKKELVSLFAPLSRLYTIVDLHVGNALLSTSSLNKKGKTEIKTRSATGREKIWKQRCERTVEWEKQQGITEKRKHKPPEGRPVSRWQQIYGRKPQEDECMCGKLLTKHEEGRCPGVQNDTQEADRAVIETLLGRKLWRREER
jgi:hypothetical protein